MKRRGFLAGLAALAVVGPVLIAAPAPADDEMDYEALLARLKNDPVILAKVQQGVLAELALADGQSGYQIAAALGQYDHLPVGDRLIVQRQFVYGDD